MSRWPRIFVDVETTGLDPFVHEIIEVCIITEWESGSIEEWHTRIRPERIGDANPKALEINGYCDAGWSSAPLMAYVVHDIHSRIRKGLLIGHNVAFDRAFLDAAMQAYGLSKPSWRTFDTMALAYEHLPIPRVSMDAIRRFLGWSSARAHTARQDTRDMRRLFHLLHRASCWRRLWWRLRWTVEDR